MTIPMARCLASLVFGLVLFAVPAAVRAQYVWQTNSDGVSLTITQYTGPGGNVIIPSQIDGLPVTAIGDGAFGELSTLTNVTIPGTVTTIGDNENTGIADPGAFG